MKNIFKTVTEYLASKRNIGRQIIVKEADLPKKPTEEMGSMLLHPLPELDPMHVATFNYNSPIYLPRRSKFKGYMRENRRCTFNKNK